MYSTCLLKLFPCDKTSIIDIHFLECMLYSIHIFRTSLAGPKAANCFTSSWHRSHCSWIHGDPNFSGSVLGPLLHLVTDG